MQKEEAKKKIEEEKEKHKRECEEAKAKKIAEKEERERNKAIRKGKGKGNGKGKGKAPKCKPRTPSTSEDEESDWSSASSEFYEGSTSCCSECDVHFRGQQKCLAIGCDTNYCHRWYHRACINIDLSGMTEKEIQKVSFVCKYC